MSIVGNSLTNQNVTPAILETHRDNARASHVAYKKKALETSAYLYTLYILTLSPSATKQARDWLDREIELANLQIAKDNVGRTQNKLKRVEARNGASKFTVLVKLVLELLEADQASYISRHCKVLERVDEEFAGKQIGSPQEIVDWITAQGGFEALIRSQPYEDKSKDVPQDLGDDRAAAAAVAGVIKEELANRQPLVKVKAAKSFTDGLFLAVGRRTGGQFEIVSTSPLPDDDLWVSYFEKDLGPNVDTTTAIANQVASLGELVDEGRVTDKTEEDLPGAKALKEERALSLIPQGTGNPTLMVSARRAKSSIVVKARSANPAVQLGSPRSPVVMDHDCHIELRSRLRGAYAVRMVLVTATTDEEGRLIWTVAPTALSKAMATTRHRWDEAACLLHPPLDVRGFDPQFTVDITAGNLNRLLVERVKVWEAKERAATAAAKAQAKTGGTSTGKSKSAGPKKRISLKFEGGSLTYSMPHHDDLALPITGAVPQAITLQFRPYDLLRVLDKLRVQSAAGFKLEGDKGGLLRFNWADSLGEYDIYLPTAGEGSGLESRLLDELRIPPVAQAA